MTSNPTASLAQAVAALDAVWTGACCGGDAQASVSSMTDAGILAVNEALATVRRQVDALHVRVAAGIADRSRAELGSEGLARKTGHRTPAKLIAATTGGHTGDAARLIQVGQATAERSLFSGERAPSRHPHVQAAVAGGLVSVAAAAAITGMLDKLPPCVTAADRDAAELALVERAPMLTLDELHALLRRAEAHLDSDGLEPHLDDLRAARGLRILQRPNGSIHLDGDFDPETGAPIVAAIEGIVTNVLRTSRGHNRPVGDGGGAGQGGSVGDVAADAAGGDCVPDCVGAYVSDDSAANGGGDTLADAGGLVTGAVVVETRTLPQMRADALADLCRHALGCDDDTVPAGASTTVVVRMSLECLTDAIGVAEIDGIAQPVDPGIARRLAATAQVVPVVLGTDSEVLDVGRTWRPFTRAQRIALAERDGGCASCGLPPAYTEAHHLRWWSHGGPTDLDNGILLCTACHHRIHNDGWEIRIDPPPESRPGRAGLRRRLTGGTVWFIPPADLDPARTPHLGGRARRDWIRAA